MSCGKRYLTRSRYCYEIIIYHKDAFDVFVSHAGLADAAAQRQLRLGVQAAGRGRPGIATFGAKRKIG